MRVPPIILVTGAGGQVGSELRKISVKYPGYKFLFKDRTGLPLDQPAAIESVMEEISPAWCINAGAYTAVDRAEDPREHEKVYAVNAYGVQQLAACCDKVGTKLLHISTDYVFDGSKREPYVEEDEVNPMNVYGDSKLQGEKFTLLNPDAAVLRTSWVYSSFGKNFVKTMVRLMREKTEISVVDDQFGSPTYAGDIAQALMKMIETKPWQPGLYHFTNRGVTTWFGFAGLIRDMINSSCQVRPITTAEYPTPAKRPAWSVLDNTKFSETFGMYSRDWQEALADCLKEMGETQS